jgi:uncharacterized protein (TIGR03435 family)
MTGKFKMLRHTRRLAFTLFCAGAALAQTPEPLAFEVASVKPSKSEGGRFTMNGGPGTNDPNRITYTNVPLRRVLLNAYDFRNYQILGPDWLNTLRFDITAILPEGATKEQFQSMLRNLLATRFQMTAHGESREIPTYALVVAKGGLKITPAAAPSASTDELAVIRSQEGRDGFPVLSIRAPGVVIETRNGSARITGHEVRMVQLADTLTTQAGRPVIDTTGLDGIYSFELYFTPEGANSGESPEPSIFGAVEQQLGLKLEARKGRIEFLVIDHIEKTPTEN